MYYLFNIFLTINKQKLNLIIKLLIVIINDSFYINSLFHYL